MFASNQMENRLCSSSSGAFNIRPAPASWWTSWMSIYNLGMGVALERFQSQAEFRKLWQPLMPVPRCQWATISTGLDPIPALAPSIDILLHTGLLDNPSLAVDKGSGLCEDLTLSLTRRKNELLDQLGSKRIINTPCCLREVQELVEVTGKASHACSEASHGGQLPSAQQGMDCMEHELCQLRSHPGLPKAATNWQNFLSNVFKAHFLVQPCPSAEVRLR